MYPQKVIKRIFNKYLISAEGSKLLSENKFNELAENLINKLFKKISDNDRKELKEQYIQAFQKYKQNIGIEK